MKSGRGQRPAWWQGRALKAQHPSRATKIERRSLCVAGRRFTIQTRAGWGLGVIFAGVFLVRRLVHHPHEAEGVEKGDIAALVSGESSQQRQNQFIIPRGSANLCHRLPISATVCQSLPRSANLCQRLPISATVCQSLPISANVCQSLPISANVCQSLPFSAVPSLRLASIGPFTARSALCLLARLAAPRTRSSQTPRAPISRIVMLFRFRFRLGFGKQLRYLPPGAVRFSPRNPAAGRSFGSLAIRRPERKNPRATAANGRR